MSKKILELNDTVTLAANHLETLTLPIVSVGTIKDSGITLEYLENGQIFVTCESDGKKTCLLLTQDARLPYQDTRETIQQKGMDFLFNSTDGPAHGWPLVQDLNDDDKSIKYLLGNEFQDDYDGPEKDFREIKFFLYWNETKDKGIAVIEVGNHLNEFSGLLTYYEFRTVPATDVSRL